MNVKKIIILLLILGLIFCGGCWDWLILEDLAIIFGIGVDVVEEEPELFQVTFVNPVFVEEAEEIKTITTLRAFSLAQALINLQHQKDLLPVLGKVDVLVFSEDAARSGAMHKILRQYNQVRENNPMSLICIVRGVAARDVINLSPPEQPRNAVFLPDLLRQNFTNGRVPEVNALHYWTRYNTRGMTPVIPVIELAGPEEEDKGILLSGLAVIDEEGRMRGYLSDTETIMFMLLTGNMKRGRFYTHVNVQEQENRLVTAFIEKSAVKLDSRIQQGKPVITINVDIILDGINVDLSLEAHMHVKEDLFRDLEQALARDFQGNIRRVLKKSQAWEADIVGLGQHVRVQHAGWFRDKDWGSEYSQGEINVETRVTIKRFGSLVNPNY